VPLLREHTTVLINLIRNLRQEVKKISEMQDKSSSSLEANSPILIKLKSIADTAKAGLFNYLKQLGTQS